MARSLSPKPKTRFKYYREVRNVWLVAGLSGLAFSLIYPSVIEPRLADTSTETVLPQRQESAWDQQLNRGPQQPQQQQQQPQQPAGEQNLPRDVSGSSGSTGGGIAHNRGTSPQQQNNNPFGGAGNSDAFSRRQETNQNGAGTRQQQSNEDDTGHGYGGVFGNMKTY